MAKQTELNDRQRRFAQFLLAGHTRIDAYMKAYPDCGTKGTASGNAARLLGRKLMQDYLQELRAELADRTLNHLMATRTEVLEFFTEVMRTPAGRVDEQNKLCQSFRRTGKTYEVRMPGKLEAAERLCRLMGWDAPQRVQHDAADGLMDLLEAIRARGGNKRS